MSFVSLQLHPHLVRNVAELGFSEPTPIQALAIPPALDGSDVLACAETGSGKTAAFLLPVLNRLLGRPRGATRALVLSPTRELAAQIASDLRDLAGQTGLRGLAVFGGVGMAPQRAAFERGVDVIVATPGRLLDHFSYPYAKLSALELLVLDEADRMLDMGFLPAVERILRHIPSRRQTLFFSATFPPEIARLTRAILRDPVEIRLARHAGPVESVVQRAYTVPAHLKASLLAALLDRGDIRDALVFTRTKHRADRLASWLQRRDIAAERIHGNRSQSQRTEALERFRRGRYRVLVATDIAARGIDIEKLGHVVNFDVPALPEDYVHRVGRTGRAHSTGTALTFISPSEAAEFARIERVIGLRIPRLVLEGFDNGARAEPVRTPAPSPNPRMRGKQAPVPVDEAYKPSTEPGAPARRARRSSSRRVKGRSRHSQEAIGHDS